MIYINDDTHRYATMFIDLCMHIRKRVPNIKKLLNESSHMKTENFFTISLERRLKLDNIT